MSRKEEYKLQNDPSYALWRTAEGIKELPCGILYRVLEEGRDGLTPRLNSVVSVHYKGTLINGLIFKRKTCGCRQTSARRRKRKCRHFARHGQRKSALSAGMV